MARIDGGCAGGDGSRIAGVLVAAEIGKRVLVLVGVTLPVQQPDAIGVAERGIGKGRLTGGAVHALAGLEISHEGLMALGRVAHAFESGADLRVETRKLRGAITRGDITSVARLPKRLQAFVPLLAFLALDLAADLAEDRREDLARIGSQRRQRRCGQRAHQNGC